ncbi:P-loop containing nucleoside triphosphate hydrolase protein [Lasiosphaeria hispida]|uniref:P-loop containing nucleoside triphosphate hydrolase protein n=1 Tax=Lasiosphaeria hispida TaxID=260671 RepID=A0AAJ0HQB3_9PEZI|nr:P-loop containing nucleoside triphosphate hydrolase protein [Lasiosphaeria hispida]
MVSQSNPSFSFSLLHAQTTMMQPKDKDPQITILLLGVTGAGKSTFAAMASGQNVKVGHGVDPCTQDPLAVSFDMDNQKVVLIDTPGFDDSVRSDVEILKDIAKWLMKEGLIKNHPLDGLILLHPATHTVVRGNERKRARLLEKILGDDAYNRVVIATTMWENLWPEDSARSPSGHDQGLEGSVWSKFCEKGAKVTKHNNTKDSAHRIIRLIAPKPRPTATKTTTREREWHMPQLQDFRLLPNHSRRVTETPLSRELRAQLEEGIDFTYEQLLQSRAERPPTDYKKSGDPERRQKYKDWEEDNRELERSLAAQQKLLNRMDTLVYKVISAFGRLFS